MNHHRILYPTIAFFCACAVGLVIAFVGLRLYFNDERLASELARNYTAGDLQVLAGQANMDKGNLRVDSLQPEGFSFVNAGNLRIDTRFYQTLTVTFADKQANQPLLLAVRKKGDEQPVERPMPYGQELVNRIELHGLVSDDAIITDVGLLTNRLTGTYRIQAIDFVPKQLSLTEFAYLLMDCFAINKQWENWSINTHRSPHWVLVPPKILVLMYFVPVGLLFLLYLYATRRPLINAWWGTLVAAWFVLDAHYLVEKTVITKNTYDTFAHLSDDEKDLVLSPEAAKIAQTIKSVLPDDGKPKKIRIDFGWNAKRLLAEHSEKRYLNGKLHYMLQPNIIYTLGVQIPDNIWQKGGFFYVDARQPKERLAFNPKKGVLDTTTGKKVAAKRLFNNDMVIYQVLGGY